LTNPAFQKQISGQSVQVNIADIYFVLEDGELIKHPDQLELPIGEIGGAARVSAKPVLTISRNNTVFIPDGDDN